MSHRVIECPHCCVEFVADFLPDEEDDDDDSLLLLEDEDDLQSPTLGACLECGQPITSRDLLMQGIDS